MRMGRREAMDNEERLEIQAKITRRLLKIENRVAARFIVDRFTITVNAPDASMEAQTEIRSKLADLGLSIHFSHSRSL